MKLFGIILFFFLPYQASWANNHFDGIYKTHQEKTKYIRLQIGKFDPLKLDSLIYSLEQNPAKISMVSFNEENRQLTIYYTNAMVLKDLYDIVSEYVPDYKRISGSEL